MDHDLRDFPAFGARGLDPDDVRSLRVFHPRKLRAMAESVDARLEALGRDDLRDALTDCLAASPTWEEWRTAALDEIRTAVPTDAGLQLIDLGQFDVPDPLDGRPVHPIWSAPAGEAATELRNDLEVGRDRGAPYLAVCSSAFWWFEAYDWFEPLLDDVAREVHRSERVRLFELA